MAPGIDSLDDDLKPLVLRIVAQNVSLLGRIDELLAQNAQLLARIAELEGKAGAPPKTPGNSSVPPSSAPKANVADATPGTSKRKGRAGVARALAGNPDLVRDVCVDRCPCGTALGDADTVSTHDYDHVDLPPIRPIVTRVRVHKRLCPCCKSRVAAQPPADMPAGSPYGPGIVALVVHLHAQQMISYARMVELLDAAFGVTISEGAIANMLARAEKPFASRAAAIAATVRASEVIASDETSARVMGKTHWQWTFVTPTAICHLIAPSRGKKVVTEFLGGAVPNVWTSDRLAAQGRHATQHQYCLAHLMRDAQYAVEAGDTIFAPKFKRFLQIACTVGRRRPRLSDAMIERHARRLTCVLARLLDLEPKQIDGRKLRDAIDLDARDKLLVFLSRRDVEPTNNASERALRPSVIFRKVTNGFRSAWGAKVYADICSVVATAKLAGMTALDGIRAALKTPAAA
jgi:transposase